jgi:hypothetical protein
MFLKRVSVKLVIKLKPETEGDSANYNVTGSEDISRLTLGIMTIGHSEPRKRIKPVNDSQNPKMSVKDRRQDILPEQMKTITLEETSSGPFADLMAQMRSSDREVAMEEVMGAMMPMPELKDENTKEAPACT